MTTREELEVLHAQQKEISFCTSSIRALGTALPIFFKVCPKSMAEQLGEPMNSIEYPLSLVLCWITVPSPRRLSLADGAPWDAFRWRSRPRDKGSPRAGALPRPSIWAHIARTDARAASKPQDALVEVGLSMHNPVIGCRT